jgi:acetyl-CoA acyltransferase 1
VLGESKIKPEAVQDIVLGNALDPLAGYKVRVSALAAGFPVTTSTMALNRFCSSGLMAVKSIAESIKAGSIDCGLAIGAESMSLSPDNGPGVLSESITSHPLAADALQPMGWTSENVAKDFHISREKHDFYAATSYQRAEKAQKNGWFEDEIVPVETIPRREKRRKSSSPKTMEFDMERPRSHWGKSVRLSLNGELVLLPEETHLRSQTEPAPYY